MGYTVERVANSCPENVPDARITRKHRGVKSVNVVSTRVIITVLTVSVKLEIVKSIPTS